MDRARKGRQGTRRRIRLDWFGVRVALGAAPGEVVRFAVHLDVIVDGKPVTVPSGPGSGPG